MPRGQPAEGHGQPEQVVPFRKRGKMR
jgi:hypothetical protein